MKTNKNVKVTLTLKQLKNLVKENSSKVVTNEGADNLLPWEVVDEFEDHLRKAQNEVEAAARIVCSSHNPTAIESWNSLNKMTRDISEIIHTDHNFRDFDS